MVLSIFYITMLAACSARLYYLPKQIVNFSTLSHLTYFDAKKLVIPHPGKKLKKNSTSAGEDDAFASTRYLGVADGVSGWALSNVDAGLYSRELMHRIKESISSHAQATMPDPVTIMRAAYRRTNAIGSTTCCLVFLDDIQSSISAANLGDSGFILFRKKENLVVARSQFQSHDFNFPLQLGTGSSDIPEHADIVKCDVEPGDCILLATDGVWDNLFEDQITSILKNCDTAQEAVERVAESAVQRSQDREWISPFGEKEAAQRKRSKVIPGGKPDDISLSVGFVRNTSEGEVPESVMKRLSKLRS